MALGLKISRNQIAILGEPLNVGKLAGVENLAVAGINNLCPLMARTVAGVEKNPNGNQLTDGNFTHCEISRKKGTGFNLQL